MAIINQKRKPRVPRYRFIADSNDEREKLCCAPCAPNDSCVTDIDILRGRIAPTYHGDYYKDSSESLNPLHRRGVDFTDLGNILASIDSREEETSQKIASRRAAIEAESAVKVIPSE